MATAAYPAPLARTLDVSETWKPVPGFEGRYEVSDQGRVWSAVTKRILRPAPTSKGYLTVQLYYDERPKRGKSFCVHDLVAAAFIGPKPDGMQVDHGREGKQCNAVRNLEYVTPAVNVQRCVERGRTQYSGPDHANAKLTADDVRMLRQSELKSVAEMKAMAKRLNVSYRTIFAVVNNQTYNNVS